MDELPGGGGAREGGDEVGEQLAQAIARLSACERGSDDWERFVDLEEWPASQHPPALVQRHVFQFRYSIPVAEHIHVRMVHQMLPEGGERVARWVEGFHLGVKGPVLKR